MKNYAYFACALVLFCSSGCASYQQMKSERDVLAAKLSVMEDQVQDLEKEKLSLQGNVNHLTGVTEVLEKEKTARIRETTKVRSGVRSFIREQVAGLREFSQIHELFDYVGSELIDRKEMGGEGLFLLDVKNKFERDATLAGAKVYSRGPTKISMCILRPQGRNHVVLWKSKDFPIPKSGLFRLTFDTPIAAQKGDRMALYAAAAMQIPYDIATGDVRHLKMKPSVGAVLNQRDLPGNTGRTYSFGVVGFLEAK